MQFVKLGLPTFPFRGGGGGGGGCLCFIIEFLHDFRKDNLMILVIRSPFPYQGLVLPH